ncbi:MAG: hypothetical protein A4E65_00773 [Syntrophorhabdus sp. PtaU1.Bin153]|nr:MAG: hypothetical protein A4E65_00773 [Syntrophorhabdus sp. PtaU1.Bin153]
MKELAMAFAGIFIAVATLWAGQEKIEVFPGSPYEKLIIYENLIIFWIGIIGLVVIIGMKLREIKRIRNMGIDREEKDIPVLD